MSLIPHFKQFLEIVQWFRAPYINADVLSDVRSNPGLALVCFSAGYLSVLKKELTFDPEKGVPTLGTPERGGKPRVLLYF